MTVPSPILPSFLDSTYHNSGRSRQRHFATSPTSPEPVLGDRENLRLSKRVETRRGMSRSIVGNRDSPERVRGLVAT